MDYQANTGRLSEVLVGIVTTFISLIFFGLVFFLEPEIPVEKILGSFDSVNPLLLSAGWVVEGACGI